ncbi:MAG: glutaredoxin 3 [Acidimicrobiia bacterium]|nr:glutaredoxin 3 [Acidimicrobiia bacterium]NNL27400.1 glutaredoxin 3 [Acidimicrobiia bacterium]
MNPTSNEDHDTPVTIYTTAWCPYCDRVKDLLDTKGVAYREVDVDGPEKRTWLTTMTGQQTVPQVYVGDRHVGGWDDIISLERAGKLDDLLTS